MSLFDENAFNAHDERLYTEAELPDVINENVNPATLLEKLNQLITGMDDLKVMSSGIGTSPEWTYRHNEALIKSLNAFKYYCELLRDDLHNYNKPI